MKRRCVDKLDICLLSGRIQPRHEEIVRQRVIKPRNTERPEAATKWNSCMSNATAKCLLRKQGFVDLLYKSRKISILKNCTSHPQITKENFLLPGQSLQAIKKTACGGLALNFSSTPFLQTICLAARGERRRRRQIVCDTPNLKRTNLPFREFNSNNFMDS